MRTTTTTTTTTTRVYLSNNNDESKAASSVDSIADNAMTPQERILRDAGVLDDDEDDTKKKKKKQLSYKEELAQSRRRNLWTALVSVGLAVSGYVWDYTHPVTPIQLLASMQQSSDSLTVVGHNGKPSVVDFWAPWCDNCRVLAPTLQRVEQQYKDRVNFVMINGDQADAWPYIQAFGVDAIPHLALVNDQGDVETALIGPVPVSILSADLDTLLHNAQQPPQQPPQEIPYTMLDVFAGKPDEARRVDFAPKNDNVADTDQ